MNVLVEPYGKAGYSMNLLDVGLTREHYTTALAAIGLVPRDMENAEDCCVVGNISENTWRLHAPALVPLVLPQK